MRRRIGEWLLSAGTVALLLLAILVLYNPVREDARRVMTRPAEEVSSLVHHVRGYTDTIAAVTREKSRTHTQLMVFGIAAVVLVGFMLRM